MCCDGAGRLQGQQIRVWLVCVLLFLSGWTSGSLLRDVEDAIVEASRSDSSGGPSHTEAAATASMASDQELEE